MIFSLKLKVVVRLANSLVIIFLLMGLNLQAQYRSEAPSNEELEIAVCVWPASGMREYPGKQAHYITPVYYGEEVQMTGDTVYVPTEARVYMHVKNEQGKTGWVHKYLYSINASQVVVIKPSVIYDSPGVPTTVTTNSFDVGDMAAMEDFEENWVKLVGLKKQKSGWIRRVNNGDVVSIADNDIAIASLAFKANQKEDSQEKISMLEAIRNQPGFAESPVSVMVMSQLEQEIALYNQPQTPQTDAYGRDIVSRSAMPATQKSVAASSLEAELLRLNGPAPSEVLPAGGGGTVGGNTLPAGANMRTMAPATNPNYSEEDVYDENTGNNYVKVTEKGGIYPVKGPKDATTIFFGYHKTLPKGTRVLVNLPDNPGFIELEIVNKLSKERSQIIGLSEACIKAIYGQEKDNEAELVYFIKK